MQTNYVPRSSFVTVTAWIFIALSGFASLISILQNIMIQTLFRSQEFTQAMHEMPRNSPHIAGFMFNHFPQVFLLFLVISLASLVFSIGLLLRKNWARLCFIGLMVFAILWQIGGIVLQLFMFSFMRGQFTQIHNAPDMSVVFVAFAVIGVLFALGFSVLFGWIARKLLSPPIAAEFGR